MPVPEFQSFMLPILRFTADGNLRRSPEVRDFLARECNLSDDDVRELLPSGKQTRFANRVGWAITHLKHAGALEYPKFGHIRITERGKALVLEQPQRIDLKLLDRFPEHRDFRAARNAPTPAGPIVDPPVETPEERLEQAFQSIRSETIEQLLEQVKKSSPAFFERLVVEMLLKMGYGRSRTDAGRAIGASGDEGIDGVISEDRLGLDTIYIQAKRWTGSPVGRPEIQKFVGALHGKRARKGVFITTSSFTAEAREYVSHIDPRVVLIEGEELAEYMLDYGLGVSTRAVYELKRIDSDFFEDEGG